MSWPKPVWLSWPKFAEQTLAAVGKCFWLKQTTLLGYNQGHLAHCHGDGGQCILECFPSLKEDFHWSQNELDHPAVNKDIKT